jgi:hypothetical protein
MNRREQHIVFVIVLLIAAVALVVSLFPGPGSHPTSRTYRATGVAAEPLPVAEEVLPTERLRRLSKRASTAVGKGPISAAEQESIREWGEKLEASFQDVEASNMKIVFDKRYSASVEYGTRIPAHRNLLLRVSPPTAAQLEEIHTKAVEAINAVGSTPAAQNQMRAKYRDLDETYFTYPMRMKMLHVVLSGDEDSVTELAEYYVNDESLFAFKTDGSYTFPPSDTSVMRLDSNVGGGGSWASKRYGHLIQIENE